jgi:hypothetical protein
MANEYSKQIRKMKFSKELRQAFDYGTINQGVDFYKTLAVSKSHRLQHVLRQYNDMKDIIEIMI